jgi:hypothetical protein
MTIAVVLTDDQAAALAAAGMRVLREDVANHDLRSAIGVLLTEQFKRQHAQKP